MCQCSVYHSRYRAKVTSMNKFYLKVKRFRWLRQFFYKLCNKLKFGNTEVKQITVESTTVRVWVGEWVNTSGHERMGGLIPLYVNGWVGGLQLSL